MFLCLRGSEQPALPAVADGCTPSHSTHAGSDVDTVVLGSSSGMLSLLAWNRRDASFASTLSPSLGRSGCLRDVPGQYIAADPRGRCVFAGQCRAVLSLQLSSCCTCCLCWYASMWWSLRSAAVLSSYCCTAVAVAVSSKVCVRVSFDVSPVVDRCAGSLDRQCVAVLRDGGFGALVDVTAAVCDGLGSSCAVIDACSVSGDDDTPPTFACLVASVGADGVTRCKVRCTCSAVTLPCPLVRLPWVCVAIDARACCPCHCLRPSCASKRRPSTASCVNGGPLLVTPQLTVLSQVCKLTCSGVEVPFVCRGTLCATAVRRCLSLVWCVGAVRGVSQGLLVLHVNGVQWCTAVRQLVWVARVDWVSAPFCTVRSASRVARPLCCNDLLSEWPCASVPSDSDAEARRVLLVARSVLY